jgi:hypothetical protein
MVSTKNSKTVADLKPIPWTLKKEVTKIFWYIFKSFVTEWA